MRPSFQSILYEKFYKENAEKFNATPPGCGTTASSELRSEWRTQDRARGAAFDFFSDLDSTLGLPHNQLTLQRARKRYGIARQPRNWTVAQRKAIEFLNQLDPKVDTTLSSLEIKRLFRQLAMIHHPDRGGNAEQFMLILHAVRVVCGKVA